MSYFINKVLKFKNLALFFILILNIIFQFFPLLNTSGYENSAVNGILIFLLSGFFFLLNDSKINKSSLHFVALLFFIPLLISIGNQLIFSVCPFSIDILFYPLIIIPAILLSYFISLCFISLSRLKRLTGFFIVFLIIALSPIFEIFYFKQIYFYHLIIGIFPGVIYDDFIPLDLKFFLYRVFVMGLTFFCILFVIRIKNKLKLLIMVMFFIINISFKSGFGYISTDNFIERNFQLKVETENFNIFIAEEADSNTINGFVMAHEYYYDLLNKTTGLSPANKINSYLFRDSRQKKKLFGAERANVAKPWQHSIFVEIGTPYSTILHEIAHIFAAEVGWSPFKVSKYFNPAMIEGYAMAIENDYDGRSLHFMAKLATLNGFEFPIQDLFSGLSFMSKASSISYVHAGSFIKYLADNYGFEKVSRVYSNNDFKLAFDKDLNELEKEYLQFMDDVEIQNNSALAQYYFGYLPVYQRYCVRSFTRKLRSAWEYYNNKEYDKSAKLFSQLISENKSYNPIIGLVYSLNALKEYKKAINLLNENIEYFQNSTYQFPITFAYADLLSVNNHVDSALTYYEGLERENIKIHYTDRSAFRKRLAENSDSTLINYLLADNKHKLEIIKSYGKDLNYARMIINLFEVNDLGTDSLVSYLQNLNSDNNLLTYEASIFTAEYLLRKGYFSDALYFINVLEKNSPNNEIEIKKNRLMDNINWILENKDSVQFVVNRLRIDD